MEPKFQEKRELWFTAWRMLATAESCVLGRMGRDPRGVDKGGDRLAALRRGRERQGAAARGESGLKIVLLLLVVAFSEHVWDLSVSRRSKRVKCKREKRAT